MNGMNEQAYYRMLELLPRLSAITDSRRLEILGLIDRVLAAEGLSWSDIAEALMAPKGDMPSTQILRMIDCIAEAELTMTENAVQFLTQLREQARQEPAVALSPRQNHWVHSLFDRAEKKLGIQNPPPHLPAQPDNVVRLPLKASS